MLATIADANSNKKTFTYDEVGNILTRTDRMGNTTQYTYDAANRLVRTQHLADGTAETRQYDVYGNLIELANQYVTYTYTYDNQNRLTSKTDTRQGPDGPISRTLAFQYDPAGNLIGKTDYQGGTTTLQYDSTNRLVALTNPDYLQVTYHYDGAGRLIDRILSNGVKTRYTYDADNRLATITNITANGTIIHAQQFQYDHTRNITRISDKDGQGTDYHYDPLYRLTTEDAPGDQNDANYTYDKVGNRLSKTTDAGVELYTYDAGNRLQEVRSGSPTGPVVASYQYDANGSRIQKQDGDGNTLQTYQYDPKKRIINLVQGSGGHTYAYDPNDYRIQSTTLEDTNHYLLEAEHLEATYDEEGQIKAKYLRGVVVDEIVNGYQYPTPSDEQTRVALSFHHNHNKSVAGLSAHEGSVLETIDYDAFGQVTGGSGGSDNRLRYTGREQDEDTGLYYYRARYYDPEVGRFLTEDPMGFGAGVNFYAYVENNPVNATDPTGMIIANLIGGVTSAVAGAYIRRLGNEEITLANTAIDFATGMAGVGILSKLSKLPTLAKVTTMPAAGSGLFVGNQTAQNAAETVRSGYYDFSFNGLTKDISTGKVIVSGALFAPFWNSGGKFVEHADQISLNMLEKAGVEILTQTSFDILKGGMSNLTGDLIDGYVSGANDIPPTSSSEVPDSFMVYPSELTISDILQVVYEK